MKFKIGVTDYIQPPYDVEQKAFPDADFTNINLINDGNSNNEILKRFDALIVWHSHIGPITSKNLKRCKIVVRYGVGYDNIDINSLNKRGIIFCNTPDYGTEEVADTACAMILNLQRKINSYDYACRRYSKGWQENIQKPILRTNTQKIGVIGVGRIGTAVINRLKHFGYRMLGYDPYQPSGHEKAIGYERIYDLSMLLEQSDIITLHCPLNSETIGMVNGSFISKMKPGSVLVNTARGNIISDFNCIENALRTKHLSAVSLDVLPEEPPSVNHNLIKCWIDNESWITGRLIINPHSAYYSEQALFEMRFKASETVRMFLQEGKLRNQIQQL